MPGPKFQQFRVLSCESCRDLVNLVAQLTSAVIHSLLFTSHLMCPSWQGLARLVACCQGRLIFICGVANLSSWFWNQLDQKSSTICRIRKNHHTETSLEYFMISSDIMISGWSHVEVRGSPPKSSKSPPQTGRCNMTTKSANFIILSMMFSLFSSMVSNHLVHGKAKTAPSNNQWIHSNPVLGYPSHSQLILDVVEDCWEPSTTRVMGHDVMTYSQRIGRFVAVHLWSFNSLLWKITILYT